MACEFSRRGGVVTLQEKTVTASASGAVSVSPDSGYNGLSKVTVNQVLLQDRTITPATLPYTVSPTGSYVGLRRATINKDSNLVAGNIKRDVSIFGVTGTLKPEKSTINSFVVTPTTVGGKVCLELPEIPSAATKIYGLSVLPYPGASENRLNSMWNYTHDGIAIQDNSTTPSKYLSVASIGGTSCAVTEFCYIRSGGKIYVYAAGLSGGTYTIPFDTSTEYSVSAMYE